MPKASETKVSRRDAILTTGKATVALGAVALFAGRLPNIQPLDTTDTEDDNTDQQQQPAGGLATAAVTYMGNDDDETSGDFEDPVHDTDEPGRRSHPVDLGLMPIQFVISEMDTTTGGTPVGNPNTVSVMTVNGNTRVSVWADQQGAQAILPAPMGPKIVVGASKTSVDVEALEDAVRGPPLSKVSFTINASGHKYLLLAFGSRFTAPPQGDENRRKGRG